MRSAGKFIRGIVGQELKRCEFVTTIPIYAKHLDGTPIHWSSYDSPEGALVGEKKIECKYVADPGHKFCPRHEMEAALLKELPKASSTTACVDCIVPRPTAEADDALGVPREWRERHNDGGRA